MAARVYATAEQLAAYPGGDLIPEGSVTVVLRIASRIVDTLLVGRKYDVDDDGLPTDTDDATALQDATCAVAVEAYASGALEAGGGHSWQSVSIGSVSLSGPSGGTTGHSVGGVGIPLDAIVSLSDVGEWWVST